MRACLATSIASTRARGDIAATHAVHTLPSATQLAALGLVACLHRAQAGGELGGWTRARRVARDCSIDSNGLRERLLFFDHAGRACWQLGLLPDTDFLAWEGVARRAATYPHALPVEGFCERLWRGALRRRASAAWQVDIVRLHALPGDANACLAISQARPSALGADVAARFARDAWVDPWPHANAWATDAVMVLSSL